MKDRDIIITGLHLELTDAIKSMVHEKLDKLFRHDGSILRIRVELEHRKHKSQEAAFVAKGHIEIHGPDLVVSAATDDLYKSVDELVEKLDRKLRRKHRVDRVKRKDTHPIDLAVALPKAL